MDKRTRARELAMQGLYQFDVQGSDILSTLKDFLIESEEDELIRKLAFDWVKGTYDSLAVCDEIITGSTLKWGLSRLCIVDKSILRLAVYQLKYCTDIPPKVVINEAIELAKKFSTDKSPSFINGVLDAILKKISNTTSA